jgi:hypothetical protein
MSDLRADNRAWGIIIIIIIIIIDIIFFFKRYRGLKAWHFLEIFQYNSHPISLRFNLTLFDSIINRKLIVLDVVSRGFPQFLQITVYILS